MNSTHSLKGMALTEATYTLSTVETQLASMGVHKDIRAQLLSHGISGVQAAHYDRYEYINEKRTALIAWEKRLTCQKTLSAGGKTSPSSLA